jgi:hypothetical protein
MEIDRLRGYDEVTINDVVDGQSHKNQIRLLLLCHLMDIGDRVFQKEICKHFIECSMDLDRHQAINQEEA